VEYDEAELISRCQQGDQEALREIFERHHQKVYRVAYGVLRQREEALDISSLDQQEGFEPAEEPERRPDRIFLYREMEGKVNEALNELPADQRTAIVLREVEGLSYQEIAETMKSSIGTVMSRLHYGRRRMQELLKNYLKEDARK
jgi:DNA-directed RNA polymerase specialized sigma24 family protein